MISPFDYCVSIMDDMQTSLYALQILLKEYNYRYLYNGVVITAHHYNLDGNLDVYVSIPYRPPYNKALESGIQRWLQIISNTIFCELKGFREYPIEIHVHQSVRNTIWTPAMRERIKRKYENFNVDQFLDLHWHTAFPDFSDTLPPEVRWEIIRSVRFKSSHWWNQYTDKDVASLINTKYAYVEYLGGKKWDPYT
jgi:hypothetical protein